MNALATSAATSSAGGAWEVHPSSEPSRVKNWRSSPVTARAPSDCSPITDVAPARRSTAAAIRALGSPSTRAASGPSRPVTAPRASTAAPADAGSPAGTRSRRPCEPGEGGAEVGQVGELARQVAEAGDERAEGVGAVAAVGAGERLASGGDRREDLVGQRRELRQGAGVDAEIEGRHGQLPVGPAEGG